MLQGNTLYMVQPDYFFLHKKTKTPYNKILKDNFIVPNLI